jgi:hypothetical protein
MSAELVWGNSVSSAVETAKSEGKQIFIDFFGAT